MLKTLLDKLAKAGIYYYGFTEIAADGRKGYAAENILIQLGFKEN